MKLQYPVDNEQIFLPHNIVQKGIYGNSDNDSSDIDPDDSGEGDITPDYENIIHIRCTPIIDRAIFLTKYFDKWSVSDNNIVDVIDAFIDIIKMHSDLKDGPIALQDPAYSINNFVCVYEYDDNENTHEIRIRRVSKIKDYGVLYLSDPKLVPTITEVLKRYKMYFVDYDKYYLVTFSAIYSLYDYIRNHKDRIIETNKYKINWNEFDKNTIIAKRPIITE
jgi:hypothetical protein